MAWITPYLIGFVAVMTALSVLVGRIRRDSRYVIGLNTAGVVLYFVAVFWAGSIGPQAFLAVAMGSLGSILFTMASERRRVAGSTS